MFKRASPKALKKEDKQKPSVIGDAGIFFATMVLLLQMAVLSGKGVETHWPLINRTTPPLNKWVWGGLALASLVWAIMTLLTAYSNRLGNSKLGTLVKESFGASAIFALVLTGIGSAQGFALAIQAGLNEWYVWIIAILGLAFYVMLAFFPLRRRLKR